MKRNIALGLLALALTGFATGGFLWGRQTEKLIAPWDVWGDMSLAEACVRQEQQLREADPSGRSLPWFSVSYSIGQVVREEGSGCYLFTACNAAGEEGTNNGTYYLTEPAQVLYRGEPYPWEDLRPGDRLRVAMGDETLPAIAFPTVTPLRVELLD